jgi:hypothetical protein
MVGASLALPRTVPIGKAVGWRLEIAEETIDHRACWAEIGVSLDSGLTPGSVELSLRGVTLDQFKKIAEAWVHRETAPGETAPRRALVSGKLFLFWRDQVGAEPSADQAPAVIDFALTALSRRSEGLQFVTKIEGRHTIYEKIERAITSESTEARFAAGPIATAAAVMAAGGLREGTDYRQLTPDEAGPEERLDVQAQHQVLAQLTTLGDAMLRRYNRRGRGAYLIRDGKLLIGPFWPVPASGSIIALTPETGFIAAQMQGQEQPVGATETPHGSELPPAARDLWRIQAVGRSDIAPGDVVRVDVPGPDSGLSGGFGLPAVAGALAGNQPVCVYVNSVRHSSARERGWTIEIAGVAVEEAGLPASAWYRIAATTASVPASGETGPRADTAGSVRGRIGTAIAEELAHRPQNDIAEVRAFYATTQMNGSDVAHAGQSSDLIVGVDDRMGGGAARRAEVNRARATRRASNTPYLTPFAWGEYGLVLPRYPGTRVMVGYHHNSAQDAVDLGALWQTDGAASVPRAAEAGDWWLILPAGASAQAAAGTAAVAPPQDAKASHDLIDANGERRIEVNGFSIRCFGINDLQGPGQRPVAPTGDNMQGGILIHHEASGAHISIATDGKITIKATGELVLEGEGIKLKPGGGTVDVG